MLNIPCFYAKNPGSRDSATGLSVQCPLTDSLRELLRDMRSLAEKHEVVVSATPAAAKYLHNDIEIHAQGSQLHANLNHVWFTAHWKHIAIASDPVEFAE